MDYNGELTAVYTRYRQKLAHFLHKGEISQELFKRLTDPLLLYVNNEAWENSKHRILFVGQETNGWLSTLDVFINEEASIRDWQNGYKDFNFGTNWIKSPFWQAYKLIRKTMEDDKEGTVLWTNLFRFCLDDGPVIRGTEQEQIWISLLNQGILQEEINVLNPGAVIFLTGPYYDFALRENFAGINFKHLADNYKTRELALLEHAGLPLNKSFRTYHPNYLVRSGKWNWFEEIFKAIEGNN